MSHYYSREGVLVPEGTPGAWPSPTTILDIIAKPEIEAWRRRVGEDAADALMIAAQERGTFVHGAVEALLNNEIILIDGKFMGGDETTRPMVQGFVNWQKKYQPEIIETELFLESRKYRYRGRCDLIVKLDGELWIVDLKTGALRWGHGYQLRFYEQAYFEMTGEHARMGVLGLTNKTKQGYHKLKEVSVPPINAIALKLLFDDYKRAHPVKLDKPLPALWAEE